MDDSNVLHRIAMFEDKLLSVKQNGVSNAAQRGAEEKINLWKAGFLMIELFNVFMYEVKPCEMILGLVFTFILFLFYFASVVALEVHR